MQAPQSLDSICSNSKDIQDVFPVLAAKERRSKDTVYAVTVLPLSLMPNEREIPVLLIMTSNAPDTAYRNLVENYRQTLSRFVGPCKCFISGNTLQLNDYSKTDWPWSMFDPEDKKIRHEKIFPEECKAIFELGKELAG